MSAASRLDAHRARRANETAIRERARLAHEEHMRAPLDMDKERATCAAMDMVLRTPGMYAQVVAGVMYVRVTLDRVPHILCLS